MKPHRAFVRDASIAARALGRYLARCRARDGAVIRQEPMERIAAELELDRLLACGGLTGRQLRRWVSRYLSHATRLHHPAYMAHQVAVTHPSGAIAAMIDGLLNNASSIYEMGSAAATIEAFVLDWLIRRVGCYDPLRELGELCRQRGLWLHVDGAHGASALLSPRQRARLDGVELADSLVWDAHKLLRTPALCAAVLVRDGRTLDAAFRQEASYLFHEKEQPGFDLLHRSVECTKGALGLRLFFVLAALGEAALADTVDRAAALAHDAWRLIDAQPDFACAVEPESNIVCFRYTGRGDDDALQIALRDRLIAAGDFYLSTTLFGGRRWLRMALMNPQTSTDDVQRLLGRLRDLAAAAAG